MNPPQVFVLLMSLAAVSVTLSSGAAPVFGGATTANVADNAGAAMVAAYTVTDTDAGDTLTYTSATAAFTVVAATGLVTTDSALGTGTTGTYVLVATDGTTPVTGTITYTVFTNAVDPTITGTKAATVAEDVSIGTDVISSTDVATIVIVTDADTANGDGFTYELSGTGATYFKMDLFTGVTITAVTLDYETTPSYSLTVTVKDSKRTAITDTLTITVTDVDEAPVCNPDTIAKNMADGAAIGTKVETLSCNDPDAGATIAYAITTGDPNSYFSVSAGVITVAKVLDRDTFASYALSVTATSSGKSDTVTVAVTILASASDAINKASRLYIVAGLLLLMKYHFE